MKRRTTDQKAALVANINREIESGETQRDACQKAGVSPSSYLKWAGKGQHSKISVIDLPESRSDKGRLFMVFGDAAALQQMIAGLQ